MIPTEATPALLSREEFAQVVRLTPLVSIDLVVRDGARRMLLGLRENRPAQGCWFVPGGRIGKNEHIEQAFRRICALELGREFPLSAARPLGVFEHLYEDNFAGLPGFGTHYVVLAYGIDIDADTLDLPTLQHSRYTWLSDEAIGAHPGVHPHVRAYCGR
jgi:colanic acid biosynthesis protein WcaH